MIALALILILIAICIAWKDELSAYATSLYFRTLHRKRCPGPFNLLRQEVVSRKPAFQCEDFWVESVAIDRRIQCPQCGRVHLVITAHMLRHEGSREE